MSRIIAVGDVHGMYSKLRHLMNKIKPRSEDRIIFVGDLIDRGPGSDLVVEYVREHGYECVRGNHEQMAIDAQTDRPWFANWMLNGGDATLDAYKGKEGRLKSDIEWMNTLPFYIKVDDRWLVSHAGVPKGYSLDTAMKPDTEGSVPIVWHRGELENLEYVQVLGHTPLAEPVILENAFYIDTGAFTSRPLTAIDLARKRIIQS